MLASPFIERVEGSRATAAGKRPKLSLASLIGQAILASPGQKARLCAIYEWIAKAYPEFYTMNTGGWQNSIRHNLTINKAFVRLQKEECEGTGKGSFWTIAPEHVDDFQDGIFTGKIRGNDYRTQAKPRKYNSNGSKRSSTSDLPEFHRSSMQMGTDLDSSTQSLVYPNSCDQHLTPGDLGFFEQNDLNFGAGYQSAPMANYSYAQAPQVLFPYFTSASNNPMYYSYQAQEHIADPACQCVYCCANMSQPMPVTQRQGVNDSQGGGVHVNFPHYYSASNTADAEELELTKLQAEFNRTHGKY